MSNESLIEEFMVCFQYFIKSEQNSLKDEKIRLTEDKINFVKEKKHQTDELEIDKLKWEENKKRVEKLYSAPDNIIDLDIGGTHKITTTRATL